MMSRFGGAAARLSLPLREDRFLTLALATALAFSLHGIYWGRYESWNADQMAFRNLFTTRMPLNPAWFHKPPFYTYLMTFLSTGPLISIGAILDLPDHLVQRALLVWSRFLTCLFFPGSVALTYSMVKHSFGQPAARTVAIILASSAGLVAFAHFLTVDFAVTFFMLVALHQTLRCLHRQERRSYATAGFWTGIATATKYNALGVGVAILAAFALRGWPPQRAAIKDLLVGLAMVPVGFLLVNPYAVIDYRTFVADFMYTVSVTPVYSGQLEGTSYLTFFANLNELIGVPMTVLLVGAFLCTVVLLGTSRVSPEQRRASILVLSVVVVYFVTFSSVPRLPARFVLPMVPMMFIVSATFLSLLMVRKSGRLLVGTVLTPLLVYNFIASAYVGTRFLEDPRMVAQDWATHNVRGCVRIESTPYTPRLSRLPGLCLEERRMPSVTGRRRLFLDVLSDNQTVAANLDRIEVPEDANVRWYDEGQLRERCPDLLVIDSLYYDRFLSGPRSGYYPEIRAFFQALLAEDLAYRIRFDLESRPPPPWAYPKTIDFLRNRITILERAEECGP